VSQMKTRRELGLLATGAVIASGLVASAKPAAARQVNMDHAREALEGAMRDLRMAEDDKGGHKAKAMQLIEQAIAEVNAGIEFANTH
jgi:hypothetical protein